MGASSVDHEGGENDEDQGDSSGHCGRCDTRRCTSAALAATSRGTSGNDRFAGTRYADLIRAFAGDDFVNALDGDDVIRAGTGSRHRRRATEGNDRVFGGLGSDTSRGGHGERPRLGRLGRRHSSHGGEGADRLRRQPGQRHRQRRQRQRLALRRLGRRHVPAAGPATTGCTRSRPTKLPDALLCGPGSDVAPTLLQASAPATDGSMCEVVVIRRDRQR